MLQFNLTEVPVMETNRLLLREQILTDAQSLFELRTNQEVMRYIDRIRPETIAESEEMIRMIQEKFSTGANLVWAIALKEYPDRMIGNLGYWRTDLANHRAELGYILHPEYWRQGILTEALSKVIDFGFNQLNLHSICANINPGNDASRQLLIKRGFVKEAYFKEDYYFNGKFLDSEIYGLLKSAYLYSENGNR